MADVELPLTGHLAELRRRLSRALLAVVVAFAVCYPQSAFLFEILRAPLRESAASNHFEYQVVGTGIAEAFFTRIEVCLIGSVFLALPVILYQLWKFVVPGLEDREARYAKGFVIAGSIFFLAGAAFCYELIFPVGFPFFLQEYTNIGVDPVLRISEYLSFTSRLMLAFGVTFEMPVVVFFLARAGFVDHWQLLNYARYAVLGIFVLAAVLTPPDAVSQMMMAVPLVVLYGLSIGVAWFFGRTRENDSEDGASAGDDAGN